MNSYLDDHLDGNAAAGDLSMLFAIDVTTACFAECSSGSVKVARWVADVRGKRSDPVEAAS